MPFEDTGEVDVGILIGQAQWSEPVGFGLLGPTLEVHGLNGIVIQQGLLEGSQHLRIDLAGAQGDETGGADDLFRPVLRRPRLPQKPSGAVTEPRQVLDLRLHAEACCMVHDHCQIHGIGRQETQARQFPVCPPTKAITRAFTMNVRVVRRKTIQIPLHRPQADLDPLLLQSLV